MNELSRFLGGWGKLRELVVATAQDMPEEHYDSAPFEGMWSFRKQVAHILNVADVFAEGLVKGAFDPSKFAVDSYGKKSKSEIVAALEANCRSQRDAFAAMPDSVWGEMRKSYDNSDKTAGELFQSLKEHEISHLNQLYLYLRSKGVLPPTTRKRLEAKAAKAAQK
jgi:uncharacterized damage-inducible protein DinB